MLLPAVGGGVVGGDFAEEESFQLSLIRLPEHPFSAPEWPIPKAKLLEPAASWRGSCMPVATPNPDRKDLTSGQDQDRLRTPARPHRRAL